MAEYKRLDFSKLNLQPSSMTFEEAISNVYPPSNEMLEALCQGNVTAEKDYDNKCVKLEISY